MAQQFCASCGARVDTSDQRFCVKCGAPVLAEAHAADIPQPSAQDQNPVDYDLSGFGQVNYPEGDYSPAYASEEDAASRMAGFSREAWQSNDVTQPMSDATQSPWQQPGTSPYPQPAPQPSGASRIVIIISVAVIALIAIGFFIMNMAPGCSSDSSVSPESTSVAVEESSSTTDVEDDTNPLDPADDVDDADDADDADDMDEDAIYRALLDAYDTMGDQNNRIKDTAATLNNTIFVADRSKRQAAADDASRLKEQVVSLLDDLKELDVPASSRYYDDQETLIGLQEDLYNRIDVMCQAWDISLQYDKPKDHESAITKPLGKDNDSKGVNIYKKDFESRYPGARPTN